MGFHLSLELLFYFFKLLIHNNYPGLGIIITISLAETINYHPILLNSLSPLYVSLSEWSATRTRQWWIFFPFSCMLLQFLECVLKSWPLIWLGVGNVLKNINQLLSLVWYQVEVNGIEPLLDQKEILCSHSRESK